MRLWVVKCDLAHRSKAFEKEGSPDAKVIGDRKTAGV